MRILAIRGANLASLAEPFEVDFEAEPIRSAGIFAITGPTGAGKTTLLDAVCLALFDSLPRMDSAEKGAAIGRAEADNAPQVKNDDVRSILRHGAGAAFAELDFVGQDGRRYRARWEVNRARGRAQGRLQAQKITLRDLATNVTIGDKKTDTLHHIEQRVGLSCAQFRRAVLLAQGDFDTFIRAGAKERAELLERITGTEIYSRISQAAFARAKQEREALHELEVQLGAHRLLDDDSRAAAERRVAAARADMDRLEAIRAEIVRAQEWYDTKARLQARLAESETALRQALAEDQTAEAERQALTEARKALSLRAELQAATTAESRLVAAETAVTEALATERQALEERDRAIAACLEARAAREATRLAYEAIAPDLDKAQRLDAFLGTAQAEVARCAQLLAHNRLAQEQAAQDMAAIEAALAMCREQYDADQHWLAEHSAVEILAVRLGDVERDVAARVRLEQDIAAATAALGQLRDHIQAAEAGLGGRDQVVATRQQQEHELEACIAVARTSVEAIDTAALETKRERLVALQTRLDEVLNAATDADKAQSGIAAADEEAVAWAQRVRQASDDLAAAETELPLVIARLQEAKHALELSEAAGSEAAEHLRLTLEEGQPCPVCGATVHPVTTANRLLRERLVADRQRVAELEHLLVAGHAQRTKAETEISTAQQAMQGISRRKAVVEADLRGARRRWQHSMAAALHSCEEIGVAMPTWPEEAAVEKIIAVIAAFRDGLETMLAECRSLLRQAAEAEAEARRLSIERDTVRAALAAEQENIRQLTADVQAQSHEEATLVARLESMTQNVAAVSARLHTALAAIFPDWQAAMAAQGVAFVGACRTLVEQWQTCRQQNHLAAAEMSRLAADLEGKRATCRACDVVVADAERQHTVKVADLDRLTTERAAIIDGRPVDEVRSAYQLRLQDAESRWNEAENVRAGAEQLAVSLASQAEGARQACQSARADHASAEQMLAEKLHASGLSREQAMAAIARGETWVAAEQVRLEALHLAVATARATLSERQQLASEHEAQGRPLQSPEQVTQALTEIETQRTRASEEFIAATAVIQRDDENRSQVAEISAALQARREQARVWGQLDELIGSADGTKFRRFAQSLTLDHLIQLANRHLADLHPRYELERAHSSDLVLQVIDHNMADEVRGVHNLSGGERFLVSLALALGLASMSSNRGLKVESLFIDEGFGALDSTSLAMAVSVLEQLQATGRRVAVISHVDELKERIGVKVEVTPVGGGRSTVRVVVA